MPKILSATPELQEEAEKFEAFIQDGFKKLDIKHQTAFKRNRIKDVEGSHNLIFSKDNKGNKICVISKDVIGAGAFGTVYSGTLITEDTQGRWRAELIADKKVITSEPSKPKIGKLGNARRLKYIEDANRRTETLAKEHQMSQNELDEEHRTGSAVGMLRTTINLDGKTHFIMQIAPGITLSDTLKHNDFNRDQKYQIIVNLLRKVAALHEAGYSHNDIKESNIHITKDLEINLVDFGLAKSVEDTELTTRGTPLYSPPEKLRGVVGIGCQKADNYAVGAIIMNLLIGDKYFYEDELHFELLKKGHEHLAMNSTTDPKASLAKFVRDELKNSKNLEEGALKLIEQLTFFAPNQRSTCYEAIKSLPDAPSYMLESIRQDFKHLRGQNQIPTDIECSEYIQSMSQVLDSLENYSPNERKVHSSNEQTTILSALSSIGFQLEKPMGDNLGIISQVDYERMCSNVMLLCNELPEQQASEWNKKTIAKIERRFQETVSLSQSLGAAEYETLCKSLKMITSLDLGEGHKNHIVEQNKRALFTVTEFLNINLEAIQKSEKLKQCVEGIVKNIAGPSSSHFKLSSSEYNSINKTLVEAFGSEKVVSIGFNSHKPSRLVSTFRSSHNRLSDEVKNTFSSLGTSTSRSPSEISITPNDSTRRSPSQ